MIVIILTIITFILAVIAIALLDRVNYYKDQLNQVQIKELQDRNTVSMIEYQFRRYTEGENPFIVLRKISDILKYKE